MAVNAHLGCGIRTVRDHTPEGVNESLTTTLDMEVSPFFSRLNAMRRAALRAKTLQQAAPTPTKKPPQQAAPTPTKKPPTKKPPTKKKTTIKIYRGTKAGGGGASANEEK